MPIPSDRLARGVSWQYLILVVSDTSKPRDSPSQEDFILLLQDLRRRIDRLLRRDGRPQETESPLLREAVRALTQRRRSGGGPGPDDEEAPS